jgi:hypothetical protein
MEVEVDRGIVGILMIRLAKSFGGSKAVSDLRIIQIIGCTTRDCEAVRMPKLLGFKLRRSMRDVYPNLSQPRRFGFLALKRC